MSEEPVEPEVERADFVDDELMAMAEREPPSIIRPLLMIGVIAMAIWIISDWTQEIEYFLGSDQPVELGDVTDFATQVALDPSWKPDIEHNSYVSLRGIPSRRSQAARFRYAKLVGGWVFIEETRDDYIEDPIERELKGDQKGDIDRTYFRGEGRMLKFSEMPKRYHGIRHYYSTRYNMKFCETLTERELAEIETRRRDSILTQWKQEFETATPQQRKVRSLTPEPTKEEVDRILRDNPPCVDAYLVQVGVKPQDHYWYLGAALIFVGFMLFNVVMLVRWVRDFLRYT